MIGEILKKKREELGLDLKEVAQTLKIRHEYLNAVEDNAFEKVPADVYTIGYIREYARLLDINPDPLVDAYKEQKLVKVMPESILIEQAAKGKKFISLRILLFAFIIGAVLTTIIIFTYQEKTKNLQKEIKTDVAVTPEADFIAPPATPQQYRLKAIATETTWLLIEMDDGGHEEVLMHRGDTKEWTSKNGFNLKIGNAGGIRLVLNDKDMGPQGKKGQVLRLRFPEEESRHLSATDKR